MKRSYLYLLCISLLIIACSISELHGQENLIRGSGQIDFLSDAPLELIQASSPSLQGILDSTSNQFAFSVAIRSFDGFNSPLQQEHFNENYLETEEFPKATFTGKIIEQVNYQFTGIQHVRAKGNFVIHGVTVHRIIDSTIEMIDNTIYIKSQFLIPLEDHNIRIPKIVHMKIAENIQVDVNMTFALE